MFLSFLFIYFQLIEDRSSAKANEEAQKRRNLADDKQQRQQVLPDLRERSRYEYLKKREDQRLELLQKRIEDDELLFKGETLTKKEKKEFELNKQILRLTKERLSINDRFEGYMMPEDYITEKGKLDKKKQESVLYQRYEDAIVDPEKFVSEQEQWENNQVCLFFLYNLLN